MSVTKKKKPIAWEEYKRNHKHFICGIDNKSCSKDCLMDGVWESQGCMYLKNYKDY